MKYRTTEIIELLKRVLKKTNTAFREEEWKSLVDLISSYGETIDKKSLQELGSHLVGNFEILGYTLNEMTRLEDTKEEVELSDILLNTYATLAYYYLENQKIFDRADAKNI